MTRDNLPQAIQRFLENALPLMKKDSRLAGVAAGGSFISGEMDAYSDLDLVLAVYADDYAGFMADKDAFIDQFGKKIACFRGDHVFETRLFICIYAQDLLHVDFKFIVLEDFAQRVEDPVILWERNSELSQIQQASPAHFPCPGYQWWEDRFWAWIYYATQKLARGEYLECVDTIAFMRNQVLGPMVQLRHGQQPRGVRFLERVAPETVAQIHATIAGPYRPKLEAAIHACINLYRQERPPADEEKLVYSHEMEQAACDFLERTKVNRA